MAGASLRKPSAVSSWIEITLTKSAADNPARIRADFRIPLAQPRDRKSAEFLVYVDYIYKVMTQPAGCPSSRTGAALSRKCRRSPWDGR